ncbi:MAG TPA: ABC transporter permease [Candidatus Dormibacteraeota bacterium]|nr:ABC transporter permease [Candidatus Dormibacteraeota bacterium]
MSTLFQDLRYAARMLVKAPGFTAIAIITLALGIGANTALFSVINATLLEPVPYPDADRMVLVWQTYGSDPDHVNIVSAPNIQDIQKQNDVLGPIAMFDSAGKGYNLGGADQPERVGGERVTANFFDVLGVKPLLGRAFLPEEEVLGKDHEVVLTYGLWQRRFGGDRAIVGKQIQVDGASHTVVGVMPKQFEFQFWSRQRELFVPVGYTEGDKDRTSNSFVAISRLKPGVTLAQAKADLDTIGKRLAKQYPGQNVRMSATVTSLLHFEMENLQTTSLALLVAVGFVLLIACVNVANLLLARGASRQKELAIRLALGATRRRLVQQLITESVLLGLLGGAAGVLVAAFGLNLFMPFLPAGLHSLPFRQVGAIAIDGRVFLFALLLSCVAGVLFGLAPALGTCSGQLIDPLKEGGGRGLTSAGGNRLRHTLVAAELALALIVLAGAGLMIDSMARLMGVNPGLNPKNVLVMGVSTAQENAYYSPPVDAHFCQEMTQQIGAISGVVSVSAIAHLPLSGGGAGRGFVIEGRPAPPPGETPGAEYSVACPKFLRTMGIPVLEGREFTDADTASAAEVVVINQAMARRYWPKEDALGKHIKIGGADSTGPWLTVVGISADFRHDGLDQKPRPSFLRPFTQAAWPTMTVVLRTASAPAAFEKPVREALAQLGGKYPPSNMTTMEQIVTDSLGSRHFPMFLLSAFALLALLLSAVGIAGVVGYSVVQRTHELGIRMALGAQQGDVLKLVLGRSMLWTFGGVAAGILGAIGLTRLLGSLLYDVKPADPLILGGTAVLLTLVALAACYVPARRAMRVDPMVALRYE